MNEWVTTDQENQVEQHNRLGLYLSKGRASAVLVSGRHGRVEVLACFQAATAPDEQAPASLGAVLAREIAARQITFGEAYAALDCRLYSQHQVHSAFTEARQIHSTIRFDLEEVVASDTTNLAIASSICRTGADGADVTVFSADRSVLTEALRDLQANRIDPAVVEPDVVCLARFLRQHFVTPRPAEAMFVVVSQTACWMIRHSDSDAAPSVRSFFLSPRQEVTAVLAREIPITLASLSAEPPVQSVFLAGAVDGVDIRRLHERTGLDVQVIDVAKLCGAGPNAETECGSAAWLAAAHGAALPPGAVRRADLRCDFLPYRGGRLIMERIGRVFSVAMTVLLVTLGAYLQLQVLENNRNVSRIREKLSEDYKAAMYGQDLPRDEAAYKRLQRVFRSLEKAGEAGGSEDENSVTSRLTYIFETFNTAMKTGDQKNPNEIDLKIDSITISDQTIKVAGDTKSRKDTLTLLEAFNKHQRLKKISENLQLKGNRDSFSINLEMKQQSAGKSQ